MIVGMHPDAPVECVLWESTSGCDLPCLVAHEPVSGVQAHGIEERLRTLGPVWHFPLSLEARAVYDVERAQAKLWELARRPYDLVEAMLAADIVPEKWRAAVRDKFGHEHEARLYCSEMVSVVWKNGLWSVPRLWNAYESQWSPVALREAALKRNTVAKGMYRTGRSTRG